MIAVPEEFRLVYFTGSSWEQITQGTTANYYDMHLRNLAACNGNLLVLHLGANLPHRLMQHPRIAGVQHAVSEAGHLTVPRILRWGLMAKRLGLDGTLIYQPYPGYNSVIAWIWRQTACLRVYQRFTYTPFRNARYLGLKGKQRLIAWVLETTALRAADWLGAGSNDLAEYAVSRGARRETMALTTNLIDPSLLPVKDGYALNATPRLVTVSRLNAGKRIDWILRAMAGLKVKLDVWGDGPDRNRLQSLADELSVNVCFHGNIPNAEIGEHLAQSDIFVMASAVEGVPKCLLEAQAVGLPVVACATPGVEEWLQSDCGMPTDESVQGLRNGVQRLLADESLRSLLGRTAADTVRRIHSPEVILAQDRAHVLKALASLPAIQEDGP